MFLDFRCFGDSFETSVPWDKCEQLCYNTKAVIEEECKRRNITKFGMSCRITQVYDAGACVYFYFAFRDTEMAQPTKVYEEIEHAARETILSSGEE
jgi:alkyldihydroxyacetonephosphate synthase